MTLDRFGTPLLTKSSRALAAFESATARLLAHRPDVDVALVEAAEADPDCAGAHALRGLCQVLLGRAETMLVARAHLRSAERALAVTGGSAAERALVRALRLGAHGGLRGAAEALEASLDDHPGAALFAKLAHALRFMAGDLPGLRTGVDRALAALPASAPGFSFLLGCRAFALEEEGSFEEAEALGRRAVDLDPTDAWAIHAVGHVHEMTGRADEGLAWIEARRASWTGCNNFALHMSWHAALFHMARGDCDAALALYDREIYAMPSEDYRDLSNAIGLLARLAWRGVDVGGRWATLADIADRRRHDTTLCFASLHQLLALIAAGRLSEAGDLAEALERPRLPGDDQELVLRQIGRPLARVLLDAARTALRPFDVKALARALPAIGGSRAQRDLFLQALADVAIRRNQPCSLATVLEVRRVLGRDDAFARHFAAHFEPQRFSA